MGKALKTLWGVTGLLGPDKEIQLQAEIGKLPGDGRDSLGSDGKC